jgi:hypothetical protein
MVDTGWVSVCLQMLSGAAVMEHHPRARHDHATTWGCTALGLGAGFAIAVRAPVACLS